MRFRLVFSILVCAGACACRDAPPANLKRIPTAWTSSGVDYADTDSLAACPTPSGPPRVFATAKVGNRVDVFDGATGKVVQSFGTGGTSAGQFQRPNGIAVVAFPGFDGARTTTQPHASTSPAASALQRYALMVVEKDGDRVQAFWADDLSPAGEFGGGELTRPYGCDVYYGEHGARLLVTDTRSPGATVKEYRLRLENGTIRGELIHKFGDLTGPGEVRTPESIVVDARRGRVLLCDEEPGRQNVKVYSLDGKFTGRTFGDGLIKGEPEGIALYETPEFGWVIVTDQRRDLSVWFVFDREDYRLLGAFTGQTAITNTDGICLYPRSFAGFAEGAMFAVNNDGDVHAYSLTEIRKALEGGATTQKR